MAYEESKEDEGRLKLSTAEKRFLENYLKEQVNQKGVLPREKVFKIIQNCVPECVEDEVEDLDDEHLTIEDFLLSFERIFGENEKHTSFEKLLLNLGYLNPTLRENAVRSDADFRYLSLLRCLL